MWYKLVMIASGGNGRLELVHLLYGERVGRYLVRAIIESALNEPPVSVIDGEGQKFVEIALATFAGFGLPPAQAAWFAPRHPGHLC